MDIFFRTINAFIEDTSVLVVIAYLLARGRMLSLLFRENVSSWESASLGMVLGLVGLTETAFPGARFPYATHTLIVTFAVVASGLRVGLVTAAVVAIGTLVSRTPAAAAATVLAVFASVGLGEAVRRVLGTRHRLRGGFVAGLLTQSCTLAIWYSLVGRRALYSLAHALISIPANAFGVMLLLLVLQDAKIRAESERHRAEAERAHALVAEAKLNALRARIHPHFLFNTLSSIAGLCGVAPDRAEAAIIGLGQLMRRVLEVDATAPLCLGEEIEHVRNYLEVEQLRFGGRLQVIWDVAPGCSAIPLPPFAIQTLVENAVQHGIAPKAEAGRVTIVVRRSARRLVVGVKDNGIGMTRDARRAIFEQNDSRLHGLQILSQQLILLCGSRARVRVFARPDRGTLAAFALPTSGEWRLSPEAADRVRDNDPQKIQSAGDSFARACRE